MDKLTAKTNFNYCQETISLKSDLELSYLDLASRLHKIQLNRMYEPNYESFDEFLEEIKISKSTASKLINIWVRFVIQFKIKPKMLADAGGWTVVAEILPYADTKKSAERWLLDAKENRRKDLRKNLLELKTGISMSKCKHKNKRHVLFWKCEDCGETGQIFAEELIEKFEKWWKGTKTKKMPDDIIRWWLKEIGHKYPDENSAEA